jgi:hypothetical protein
LFLADVLGHFSKYQGDDYMFNRKYKGTYEEFLKLSYDDLTELMGGEWDDLDMGPVETWDVNDNCF